ncbi:MAG: hypothetical protein UW94_C0009G0071 [Parcubacteria group bacterium GW2011_GWA2_45_14]|nr:MAG: hypothetical protein UW94_C0009G0071 [Parcubacteria group bacterium GW2011_GWA2_45_14]
MTDIRLVDQPISRNKLKQIAKQGFGDMVKAVVDIEKELMVLGGDLHADEEAWLLDQGSKQENLWGINIYHELDGPDMIEYDSMINIRPKQNNLSRNVEDKKIREIIAAVVTKLIAD